MQSAKPIFLVLMIPLLLTGCVTVEDLQRSTDLIRTDNELTRLLLEVRPADKADAEKYLIGLASHAGKEADALKNIQGRQADAIAYYRIAATAYWRSGRPEAVNKLFDTADQGMALCAQLGDEGPDRDCLFLRLVIPFAGLESIAQEDLSGSLETVNFNDQANTSAEIETMQSIRTSLALAKGPMETILAIGEDDRLLSHPSMREYYCENAKDAVRFFNATAGIFVTKVRAFDENLAGQPPPLGISIDEARQLRKLNPVPAFCN